jgi:hypothetical protein
VLHAGLRAVALSHRLAQPAVEGQQLSADLLELLAGALSALARLGVHALAALDGLARELAGVATRQDALGGVPAGRHADARVAGAVQLAVARQEQRGRVGGGQLARARGVIDAVDLAEAGAERLALVVLALDQAAQGGGVHLTGTGPGRRGEEDVEGPHRQRGSGLAVGHPDAVLHATEQVLDQPVPRGRHPDAVEQQPGGALTVQQLADVVGHALEVLVDSGQRLQPGAGGLGLAARLVGDCAAGVALLAQGIATGDQLARAVLVLADAHPGALQGAARLVELSDQPLALLRTLQGAALQRTQRPLRLGAVVRRGGGEVVVAGPLGEGVQHALAQFLQLAAEGARGLAAGVEGGLGLGEAGAGGLELGGPLRLGSGQAGVLGAARAVLLGQPVEALRLARAAQLELVRAGLLAAHALLESRGLLLGLGGGGAQHVVVLAQRGGLLLELLQTLLGVLALLPQFGDPALELGGARLELVLLLLQADGVGPRQRDPLLAVLVAQAQEVLRLPGLVLERADGALDLLVDVLDAGQVLGDAVQLELGLVLARLVAADAGGLLEHRAPLGRVGRQHGVDLALRQHHVAAHAEAGVHQDVTDLLALHLAPVEQVLGLAAAEQAPPDRHLAARLDDVPRVIGQDDLDHGVGRGRAALGALEDHVVHLVGAQRLGGALAHHPQEGVDDVRLAAAVGTDDAGQAALHLDDGAVGEGLEALEFDSLEKHAWGGRQEVGPGAARRRRSGCCRAASAESSSQGAAAKAEAGGTGEDSSGSQPTG